MQQWLLNLETLQTTITTSTGFLKLHLARSKTLASRIKNIVEAMKTHDSGDTNHKAYYSMLLATLEEISDYFKLLQTKDNALGKRVMRYGCDEESFAKWNETLQTCSLDLNLGLDVRLFDENQDLRDFELDLETLRVDLKSILEKVLESGESADSILKANQKLLNQQQNDRTQYRTLQATKAEKTFDPKLLRYEEIIGSGGMLAML